MWNQGLKKKKDDIKGGLFWGANQREIAGKKKRAGENMIKYIICMCGHHHKSHLYN
jgi:hypothetical protein